MSHDIYLAPREGQFTRGDFQRYFRSRPNYQVGESEAVYENESTGVYFVFEYMDPMDPEELDPEDEVGDYPVALNINYCRPACFGLEAEMELTAFTQANSMLVHDPQSDEPGFHEYSAEEFQAGYVHGNSSSYGIIVEQNITIDTLPRQRGLDTWHWNYGRAGLQEQIGDQVFVPQIMLARYRGSVVTAVVWGDATGTLIPETDLLLIVRDDLAPRRFFRKTRDFVVVPFADFKPLFEQHKAAMVNGAYQVCHPTVPQEIVDAVKALKPGGDKPEILSLDKVVDQETLDQHRS